MKILNLYAGVGGNRRLWPEHHEVTAVEYDPKIAAAYADLYPDDEVITGDAHEYLLHHHDEFDFIWSSPPCQSHSRMRYHLGGVKGFAPKYPDMRLYEEIVLLRAERRDRPWVVENVLPWYEPLIPAQQLNRHLYWANFDLSEVPKQVEKLRKAQIPDLQELHGIDLSPYRIPNKRQVLRNMVPPSVGLSILNDATRAENQQNRAGACGRSGIRGVTWDKSTGKWKAQAQPNGNSHHLGLYADIKEAEGAATEWRRENMPFSVTDQGEDANAE